MDGTNRKPWHLEFLILYTWGLLEGKILLGSIVDMLLQSFL